MKTIKWRQHLLLSLFFCVNDILASTLTSQLEVGDWVLRSGRGQESALIKRMSDSGFSHIGMVVATDPQVAIVHATTSDDAEHPNQVILSTFNEYRAPELSQRIAIIRPTFINHEQKQAIAAHMMAFLGQPFVLVSKDNAPRYCTTIIYDAIRQEYPAFELPWQTVTLSLVKGEYLFPQAFLDYPHTTLLFDSAATPSP